MSDGRLIHYIVYGEESPDMYRLRVERVAGNTRRPALACESLIGMRAETPELRDKGFLRE